MTSVDQCVESTLGRQYYDPNRTLIAGMQARFSLHVYAAFRSAVTDVCHTKCVSVPDHWVKEVTPLLTMLI